MPGLSRAAKTGRAEADGGGLAAALTGRKALWLWALALAFAMNAANLSMALYRRVWQSHYPALAAGWANDGRFAAVNWFGTGVIEEIGYAARAQHASRRLLAYDPYVSDWRSPQQLVNDFLTYTAMGLVDRVTGDISRTWIAVCFLCCLLWFWLVYRLMKEATDSGPCSLFCAVLVTGFSYLLTFQFATQLSADMGLKQLVWTMLSYGRTEGITRLPRPGVTYAFAFAACCALANAARLRTPAWAAAAGLAVGCLAYVRVDVWTVSILAAWLFAAAVSLRERRPAWTLLGAAALASVVSLPFLYYCYPPDPELLARNGGGEPDWSFHPYSLWYLAAAVAGLSARRPVVWLLGSMAGGLFVMVNINMLTGYLTAVWTWRYFGHIYVFLVAMALLPEAWRRRSVPWVAASAAMVFAAAAQGLAYGAIHFPFQGLPRDYEEALTWLERNAAPDDEVLSLNPEINGLVPAFTKCRTSMAYGVPVVSSYPMVKNAGRLASALRLLGADEERYIRECLLENRFASSREMANLGFARGDLEKTQAVGLLFSLAPEPLWRRALEEGRKSPTPIAPRYLWFGTIERQYGPEAFPGRGREWVEVYRNRSLTLFRREEARPAASPRSKG